MRLFQEAIMVERSQFGDHNPAYLEQVLAAKAAWTQAHLALDLETIARIMGPDYTQITSSGEVIGREQALASYRGGERRWEAAASDQLDVRLYGDTAVVICRWRARGVNHGVRFDYTARFACVYVRRQGSWQIVLDQSTAIIP
jgi:ketosteroid isomerase-like protein